MGTINSLLSHALSCPPSICTRVISYLWGRLLWRRPRAAAHRSSGQGRVCSAAAGGVSPQHTPRGREQAQVPQGWGSAGPEHPAGAPFLVHAGKQGVQPGRARVRAGTCTHGPGYVCARARMRVQVCMCEGVGLRRALLLVDLGGGGGLPGPQCGPSVHVREAWRGVGAAVNPRGKPSAATRWERGLGTAQIAFGKVNCGLAFGRTCLAGHSVRAEAAGREAWRGS